MSLSLPRRLFVAAAIILVAMGLTYAAFTSQRAAASHVPTASYSGLTSQGLPVSFSILPDGTEVSEFTIEIDSCLVQPVFEVELSINPQQAGHPFAGVFTEDTVFQSWRLIISGSFSPGGNASGTWDLEAELPFIGSCVGIDGTWTATTPDTDGDGCVDAQESGSNEELGGRRDLNNPYDFYDTNGDRVIDLFNDIFNVANAFGDDADSDPPGEPDGYDASLDRSAAVGDPWDMQAPDGLIDLFTDIFGVAFQFGHDCT